MASEAYCLSAFSSFDIDLLAYVSRMRKPSPGAWALSQPPMYPRRCLRVEVGADHSPLRGKT